MKSEAGNSSNGEHCQQSPQEIRPRQLHHHCTNSENSENSESSDDDRTYSHPCGCRSQDVLNALHSPEQTRQDFLPHEHTCKCSCECSCKCSYEFEYYTNTYTLHNDRKRPSCDVICVQDKSRCKECRWYNRSRQEKTKRNKRKRHESRMLMFILSFNHRRRTIHKASHTRTYLFCIRTILLLSLLHHITSSDAYTQPNEVSSRVNSTTTYFRRDTHTNPRENSNNVHGLRISSPTSKYNVFSTRRNTQSLPQNNQYTFGSLEDSSISTRRMNGVDESTSVASTMEALSSSPSISPSMTTSNVSSDSSVPSALNSSPTPSNISSMSPTTITMASPPSTSMPPSAHPSMSILPTSTTSPSIQPNTLSILDPITSTIHTMEPRSGTIVGQRTTEPTNEPRTISASESPSSLPSLRYSDIPTSIPTSLPTSSPSNSPSDNPSTVPTNHPTSSSTQLYEYSIGADMNVNGPNEELTKDAIELWEELTANFLLQKLLANYRPGGGVIDSILLLEVSFDNQFDFLRESRLRRFGTSYDDENNNNNINHSNMKRNIRQRRKIQSIQTPAIVKNEPKGILLLQFTINLSFRTVAKDSIMNREIIESYIQGSFDSDNDKQLYILLMKQQASISSSPSHQQLSRFDSISVEVTNVHQIYPKIEILSTSSSRVAIITGTTIGCSVFFVSLIVIYLKWNRLWLFRPKDEEYFFGSHIPLADQNSSLPSLQSSLRSIPTSIIASKKDHEKKKNNNNVKRSNKNNGSSSSSDSQRILEQQGQSAFGQHPNKDKGAFVEEEKIVTKSTSHLALYPTRQKSLKKSPTGSSFEYSLSDQGSSPHDSTGSNINFFHKQATSHKYGKLAQSASTLSRIDDEDFFANKDVQGPNYFKDVSSVSSYVPASSTLKHENTSQPRGTARSYSSVPSKIPFNFGSSDEEGDPTEYFFKDGLKIPKNSSSSSSSSSGMKIIGRQNKKPMSPLPSRTTQMVRPVTVVSAGSSKNSSVMSSMGVEELIMSSPMSGQVSLFSDDDSALDKFGKSEIVELTAPAGVLGLVIDTVHGGIPTVFSVKEDSIIADKVQEGDRLISVNGIDTTELSARNVSKIISRFKDTERTMIFFRQKLTDEITLKKK